MGPHPTDWVGALPWLPVATVPDVRHGISIPPYDELSDPNLIAELAAAAERRGWDGVFVWDHVMRPPEETELIGSATVSLAAIAAATTTIRFGAMVTPITRRRPQVFARETTALDRLSGGRLIVGLGLGVDRGGELSKFGEETVPREMGRRLEAGAEFLIAAWSGEPFARDIAPFRHGEVRFLPHPVQRPHPPIWFAARGDADRPVRRAARLGQGLDLVEASADRVREVAELIASIRGDLDGFDIICPVEPGTSGDEWADTPVTWVMHEFESPPDIATIERVIEAGPPR
jgi:alkanesulfonate monooxygenase SsuD/methylene tetrahydromethanopterin reductase-like flavin-dependent oxidoreductase (luciferase family)